MINKYKKKINLDNEFIINYRELSKVHTICVEARCPNIVECFKAHTATYLILGNICTRDCKFCGVKKGKPHPPDITEIKMIKTLAEKYRQRYIVITSVTRDDMRDGGCNYYCDTVSYLKKNIPEIIIELLIPDFKGNSELIKKIAFSGAEVIGHNIEIPERLYKIIRPSSSFQNSLKVLTSLKKFNSSLITKTAIILGLGETKKDLLTLFKLLSDTGADILIMGQYFPPSKNHYPVQKYYTDEEFAELKFEALQFGFKEVISFRFARSSYKAYDLYKKIKF